MAKDTAHPAHPECTLVNRSEVAKDNAHHTQLSERAHR